MENQKQIEALMEMLKELDSDYNAIWNEAIEAVIDELDKIGHTTDKDNDCIRKLKK